MKKYILTVEGIKEVNKLKVSMTHHEAGLSRPTIDNAKKTGIFSEKTLKAYFKKNIVNFQENIHYCEIEIRDNNKEYTEYCIKHRVAYPPNFDIKHSKEGIRHNYNCKNK